MEARTFAIGAFVQSGPEWYVIAVTLCIGLAAYEKRIGSLRTAIALFGTQLAATLVTAALLWPRANESGRGRQVWRIRSMSGFPLACSAYSVRQPQ